MTDRPFFELGQLVATLPAAHPRPGPGSRVTNSTRPVASDRGLCWTVAKDAPVDVWIADVFPDSDRIVDLASVGCEAESQGPKPVFLEIDHPWPPNGANRLEPGEWRIVLLVCGDNIKAQRYFVTLAFDGQWPEPGTPKVSDHFRVDGPSLHPLSGPIEVPQQRQNALV
jgi:hypothetical protein